MKKFYPVLVVLVIAAIGCRVDELSPCDAGMGTPGMLCKEYRYQDEAPIGYLSYYYSNDDILTRVDYKSIEGDLKKYVIYEYDDDKLIKETAYGEGGDLLEEITYTYNDDNKVLDISSAENGVTVSNKTFEYSNSVLQKESEFKQGALTGYIQYQYFVDDGQLFKKTYYDGNGTILNYTTHEYFSNGYKKYKHFTPSHVLTGYDVEHYNAHEKITRFTAYSPEADILNYITFDYNHLNQLATKTSFDEDDKIVARSEFMYYLK